MIRIPFLVLESVEAVFDHEREPHENPGDRHETQHRPRSEGEQHGNAESEAEVEPDQPDDDLVPHPRRRPPQTVPNLPGGDLEPEEADHHRHGDDQGTEVPRPVLPHAVPLGERRGRQRQHGRQEWDEPQGIPREEALELSPPHGERASIRLQEVPAGDHAAVDEQEPHHQVAHEAVAEQPAHPAGHTQLLCRIQSTPPFRQKYQVQPYASLHKAIIIL